jgi:hypothetical protein
VGRQRSHAGSRLVGLYPSSELVILELVFVGAEFEGWECLGVLLAEGKYI